MSRAASKSRLRIPAKPRIPYFFTNISIFTPKRINVAENSPSCEHLVVDVIKKNRYCITVGLKLPERLFSETRLLDLRVSIFEARVLSQSLWSEFQIWGCGRDARNFIAALSENAKKKIIAIVDIDEKKIGKICNNLPIEHFSAQPEEEFVLSCALANTQEKVLLAKTSMMS